MHDFFSPLRKAILTLKSTANFEEKGIQTVEAKLIFIQKQNPQKW